MSAVAIRCEKIAKRYRIGVGRHDTLRDQIAEGVSRLFQPAKGGEAPGTLWALRDVSFEVQAGEVAGIIGRNGAGKSTLLKILSRITEPTQGRAVLFGRVGSLLEVGTGFHPELTGRENIFLNGAILGMRREEIQQKFDEIVAFSEIERFLDTPVKRYSSGMYVRLAFAVAAHLEPEILLVDEVLAVGDVAFQRKCLGKMGEVAGEGRTVLFVSHNMAAVQALCTRGIFLRKGTIWFDGSINDTISTYLRTLEEIPGQDLAERVERRGKGALRLTRVEISEGETMPAGILAAGRPAQFSFYLTGTRSDLTCTFTIYDQYGKPVANFNSATLGPEDVYDAAFGPRITCELDELLLAPGRYRINVALTAGNELEDHLEGAAFFDVDPGQLRGRPVHAHSKYGVVTMPHRWKVPLDL
ncbi:MAG: ABC transporter ATP-binding protein [Anaerolineae bacterium]|nr:ABC transporter ATP-binding protein [Anaerolineae bacterium]